MGLVDVVKLDILALGRERFSSHAQRLKSYGLVVLAEKVETHEDYAYCADAGSELFQGYFFCKPELVSGRKIAASSASLLQLIAALQDPGVSLSTRGADRPRYLAQPSPTSLHQLSVLWPAWNGEIDRPGARADWAWRI